MVSVAAGMARAGAKPWVYSIAPFCYARPFEQIRNDVCLNALGVRLVGNGGGYGYGSMGATHHALEDYGVMSTLPGMRAYLPAFDADVRPMVRALAARAAPSYLRLGRSELEEEGGLPPYGAWRRLQDGEAGVIVVAGPIAGGLWRETRERAAAERPALWVVSEIGGDAAPMAVPAALLEAISAAPALGLVEEHVAPGGLGQQLAARSGARRAAVAALGARACARLSVRPLRLAELASPRMRSRRAGHTAAARRGRPHELHGIAGAGAEGSHPGAGRKRLHRRQPDARALGDALGRVRHGLARAGLATRGLERRPAHHRRSARARQPHGASGPRAARDGVRLRGLWRLLVRAGHRTDVSDQRGVQAGADRAAARARHALLRSRRQLLGIRRPGRGARRGGGSGAQQPLRRDQERGRRPRVLTPDIIADCAARTCGFIRSTVRSRTARA